MFRTLSLCLLLLLLAALLTAVPRNYVVVEIGTGTWCQYCPGAAMGADDLVNNGHPVAIIENHYSDTFANTYSNARNTYYGITGYPTAYFDGLNPTVGGSATTSMYSSYLPKVNARLAVASHYTISATGSMAGNNITINATVAKPEADSNTNVVLHCAFTESHIAYAWQNQTELNFVNRLMSPNQSGTPISLATGGQTTVTLNATWNAGWGLDHAEVVFFLQNTTSKEVLQAMKYNLMELVFTDPPNPAVLVSPADGSIVLDDTGLAWSSGGNYPSGYRLYLGTDGGGSSTPTNLVNGLDMGLATSYQPPAPLAEGTVYYWQIIPYNSNGNAVACPVWTFSTNAPATGVKTIGPGGDFSTLTAAINYLNFNLVGPGGVTFNIEPGTYQENPPPITVSGSEGSPVLFRAAPGARINPVVKPLGGTDSFGFKLDGVSWITFDGVDVANQDGATNLAYGYWINGSTVPAAHNTIRNCNITLSSSNTAVRGIYLTGQNSDTVIQANTLDQVYNGIYLNGVSGQEMQNISVLGNVLTNVRYYGIYNIFGVGTVISGNSISYVTGSALRIYGISVSGASSTSQIDNNVISGGSSSNNIYGIYLIGGTNQVHNNTVSNLTGTSTGPVYGVFVSNSTYDIHHNTISGLASGGHVYGLYIQTVTLCVAYSNVITGLTNTGSGNYVTQGIRLASGTECNLYNNMISGLNAPNATSVPQVSGIEVTGGTTGRIYHNSVFLSSSAVSASFSSAALRIVPTTNSYSIKNNIFVNLSTPGASGRTVAFWKAGTGFDNISDTDANIYYAGTPGAANLIFYDGTTGYQTLTEYQAAASIDQNSHSENAPFISVSAPFDLHLRDDVPTFAEGSALPLAMVGFDFDGEARHFLTPDIGADEGDFLPLDLATGHVVLTYPADNAANLHPQTVELGWQPPLNTPAPLYYEVFASTDPDNLFDGYFFETADPALALSAQPGVDLGYGTRWFWGVLPVAEDHTSPDPESPGFMVWSFVTLLAPVSGLNVQASGTALNFTWTASPTAVAYRIYGSDDPYAETWDFIVQTADTQYSLPLGTQSSRFYRITAVAP